jgi:hypothetical protein
MNPTDLGQFLIQKAEGHSVNIVETQMEGNKILFKLENSEQAITVQKLSGIKFKSTKLIINFASGKGAAVQTRVRENVTAKLNPLVEERYNKENKFLNLAGICAEPTTRLNFNDTFTMRNLFKVIANKCQGVRYQTSLHNASRWRQSILETIELEACSRLDTCNDSCQALLICLSIPI